MKKNARDINLERQKYPRQIRIMRATWRRRTTQLYSRTTEWFAGVLRFVDTHEAVPDAPVLFRTTEKRQGKPKARRGHMHPYLEAAE